MIRLKGKRKKQHPYTYILQDMSPDKVVVYIVE